MASTPKPHQCQIAINCKQPQIQDPIHLNWHQPRNVINPKMLSTADGFNPKKLSAADGLNPKKASAWIGFNSKTTSTPKCHQLYTTLKRHQPQNVISYKQHQPLPENSLNSTKPSTSIAINSNKTPSSPSTINPKTASTPNRHTFQLASTPNSINSTSLSSKKVSISVDINPELLSTANAPTSKRHHPQKLPMQSTPKCNQAWNTVNSKRPQLQNKWASIDINLKQHQLKNGIKGKIHQPQKYQGHYTI